MATLDDTSKPGSSWPLLVRRPQLADEAAAYIRDLIVSGRLQAGARIRPDAVAAELDASATPVREALQALRSEGFVRLEPRRGFVVAEITPQDIADVFLVQADVAGELAARAAAAVTPEGLARLDEVQAELIATSDAPSAEALEELNFQFHQVINHAAASPKLALFLRVAVHYAPRYFYASIPGWPAATIRDHERILSGLHARDPEEVRAAMRDHIQHAGRLLVAHFERGGHERPPEDLA